MRFRLDGVDGGVGQPDHPKPRTPPPPLDRRQCVEFLKLVHDAEILATSIRSLPVSIVGSRDNASSFRSTAGIVSLSSFTASFRRTAGSLVVSTAKAC